MCCRAVSADGRDSVHINLLQREKKLFECSKVFYHFNSSRSSLPPKQQICSNLISLNIFYYYNLNYPAMDTKCKFIVHYDHDGASVGREGETESSRNRSGIRSITEQKPKRLIRES